MSVLSVPSPVLAKRHFDEGDAGEGFDRQLGGKRTRQHYSPAAARCVQFAAGGLYAVPPTTLSALLALFPGMDERTVSNVLSECGNNIDAAIRRLGELRLSTSVGVSGATEASGLSAGPSRAADASSVPGTPPGPSGAAAAAAAPASTPQQDSSVPGSAGPDGGLGPGPVTAEQWVDVLVGEMSAATDLANARQRAAGFLRQFEAFISRYLRQQQAAADGSSDSGPVGSISPSPSPGPAGAGSTPGTNNPHHLASRAAKLAEENAVLKKAVQIQHRQLQERAAGQEAEVAQLKAMLAQYQEQVRTLQISNYSLSLHLQKATTSGAMDSQRNPDVF